MRLHSKRSLLFAICFFVLGLGLEAVAQWYNESLSLKPGWNAVFIQGMPRPSDCDSVFSAYPIEGVWMWNSRIGGAQFEVDPSVPSIPDEHWLVWYPTNHPQAFLSTLESLESSRGYLVKVSTNASPYSLTLPCRALTPYLEWVPESMNLVGFPLSPSASPSFDEYFRHSADIHLVVGGDTLAYRVQSDGSGFPIRQMVRDKLEPGAAYWIECKHPLDYVAPIEIDLGGTRELDYGSVLSERTITFRNVSVATSQVIEVRQRASLVPPAGQPELAGPVPLAYYGLNASNQPAWLDFPAGGLTQSLATGGVWSLRVTVKEGDLATYTPTGTNGAEYQSILEVTDGARMTLQRIPVTVGLSHSQAGPQSMAGLWIGEVVLDKVSAPYFSGTNLLQTPAPFRCRLIVHVADDQSARLLQQVIMVLDTSGATNVYKVFGDDTALPASSSRLRISSAVLPPIGPVGLSGSITGILQTSSNIVVNCNDPVNPFLHRYHPNHDNKDGSWSTYTEARETYTIERAIRLENTGLGNDVVARSIYGGEVVAGTYHEVLTGVRKEPLHMGGTYILRRISRQGSLE